MPASVTPLVDELIRNLRTGATAERAEQEKRYLKSDLEFIGATAWVTWRTAKEIARREHLDHDGTVALVEALWEVPVFERRAAAVAILELNVGMLGPEDLPLLLRLVRESGTWALVDGLAADVLGALATRDPAAIEPELDRWAADADFWVRRTSLLAELRPLKAGGDIGPFARRADAMLDEREFFIRKAIGWVLRETGKRRPDDVIAWLEPRVSRASGVTMREAVKYLPPEDRERLLAAYQARGRGGRGGAGLHA